MEKKIEGITSSIIEDLKTSKAVLGLSKTSTLIGIEGNIENLDLEIWDKSRIDKEIEKNPKLGFMSQLEYVVKGTITVVNSSLKVVAYVNNALLALLIQGGVVTVEQDGNYSFYNGEVKFTANSVKKTNSAKLTAEQLKEFSISELKGMLDTKGIDYKSSDNKETLIGKLL